MLRRIYVVNYMVYDRGYNIWTYNNDPHMSSIG
jgi:hypothetical protein